MWFKYANVILEISKSSGCDVIDLFHGIQAAGDDWKKSFNDGLHFSSVGNQFVYNEIVKLIAAKYPHIQGGVDSPLPLHYPHWSLVNPLDHESSFLLD
jgi:hypothetical protein